MQLDKEMFCVVGYEHTICLANDGTVSTFGSLRDGKLGIYAGGHYECFSVPCFVTSLPKIKQISCGLNFTACIDEEGLIWTFGNNMFGQLGTGNKDNFPYNTKNSPRTIKNILPVISVSCGEEHMLFITNDSYLWSLKIMKWDNYA